MADATTLTNQLIPEWPLFRDAAAARRTDQCTACDAWTVRDVLVHQAGNAEELERVLRAHLDGGPVPPTRSFEEREAPFHRLPDDGLWEALTDRIGRLARTSEQALDADGDALVPWTGRQMRAAWFGEHMREELVLHRWDIAGDDEVSDRLLAERWLTVHSVVAVGRPLLRAGVDRLGNGTSFTARLRVSGEDDVVVGAGPQTRIELRPPEGSADIESDAGARVLVLWGRRPSDPGRLRSTVGAARLERLRTLLSGY
jgi:Mycothiol maleylpyruvate isomerase N-terminal domain